MKSESIPADLIIEILSRLPAKSIARFRSVSKQWASIPDHPQFKALFLTNSPSSPHPRLIFAIEENCRWGIFSLPQHLSPASSSSSLVVTTPEFHMKFPPDDMWIFSSHDQQFACGYASGLIYFYGLSNTKANGEVPVVCNPKTGRYDALPYISRYSESYSFLGFDPVGKQYKVLHMAYPCYHDDNRIMTLGTRGMRWRKIESTLRLEQLSDGLCINGVLYYLGDTSKCDDICEIECEGISEFEFVIACFDVRSEEFSFLFPESFCELINYNGKLGLVYYDDLSDDAVELRVWVLEDVKKQEWSKYAYTLRGDKLFPCYVSVVGVISSGEIVLSMADYTSNQPFYVYYYNPEGNTIRRIEIQGFGEYHKASNDPLRVRVFVDDCSRFYSFADNVEDLSVNDSKLLKSSIYTPYVYNEEEEEDDEYVSDGDGRSFYGKKRRSFRGKKKRGLGRKKIRKRKRAVEDRDDH